MSITRLVPLPGGRTMTDGPIEDLWDIARAARFLGLSRSWVYRAAEAGKLPYRKVGSRLRFVPSELCAWVDGRGARTA